ncbi:MAG: hypothetical protein IIA53_03360 [Chloroflexi bacterium]|nr:hypothetical protein [Chloroflexota bacterium]
MTRPDSSDIETGPNSRVPLKELTTGNFVSVMNPQLAPDDQRFIATNDRSTTELPGFLAKSSTQSHS